MDPGRNILDAEPEPMEASSVHLGPAAPSIFRTNTPDKPRVQGNRRSSTRYRASGRAQVRELGGKAWRWAMLCDMSLGGCYLEMPAPFPAGETLEINLIVAGIQFQACAEVIACHPNVGIAIYFKPLSPFNQEQLFKIMEQLSKTQIPV
jgi:hypothetical protein